MDLHMGYEIFVENDSGMRFSPIVHERIFPVSFRSFFWEIDVSAGNTRPTCPHHTGGSDGQRHFVFVQNVYRVVRCGASDAQKLARDVVMHRVDNGYLSRI
jgi:hypothetical protein